MKKWLYHFRYLPLAWLMVSGLILSSEYVYFRFAPRSTFFTWFEQTATRDFAVDETIRFKSDNEVKADFEITFLDQLLCSSNADHAFTKVKTVTSTSSPGPRERNPQYASQTTGFTLEQYAHDREAICFLRSRICMELPLGISRCQTIFGEEFEVVNADN